MKETTKNVKKDHKIISVVTSNQYSDLCYDVVAEKYYSAGKYYTIPNEFVYRELYVISNEPIKEGDAFINTNSKRITHSATLYDLSMVKIFSDRNKKIIATSNRTDLPRVPSLPRDFLIEYCELNGDIKYVTVEHEEHIERRAGIVGDLVNHVSEVRVNDNNEAIFIVPLRIKTYSGEEVRDLIKLAMWDSYRFVRTYPDDTIREINVDGNLDRWLEKHID